MPQYHFISVSVRGPGELWRYVHYHWVISDWYPFHSEFNMMTSSNGNLFRFTGPLLGEAVGRWWIPLTKARDAELCFSLMCTWTNGWANSRNGGDLRCHSAHRDVILMRTSLSLSHEKNDQKEWFCLCGRKRSISPTEKINCLKSFNIK